MRTRHTRNGFTLIELLVVIAIIGVLAGILIPVVGKAVRQGKETAAKTQTNSILTAIKQYQAEYGKLPVRDNQQGDSDIYFDNQGPAKNTKVVMKALMAEDTNSDLVRNPRGIVFLEPPGTDLDGTYLDVWGNPYLFKLDTDYDGKVEHPGYSSLNANEKTFKTSAIVISFGEDGVEDTEDDLATHEPNP